MARRRPLWRRLLLENTWLKITSMVIAVALYFLVREDKGKEVDVEVPVVLSNLSEKEVFVGDLPRALRVRVRDRWSRLARALERKANPYLVDLRGFQDETVFVFERERIRQLVGVPSVSIQSVYPSDFVVRLEPKTERFVPVQPTLVGEPGEGYDIPRDSVKLTPATVKVWGARSSVKEVADLATHPIDLSKLDRDARVEVQIQKPNLPFLFIDEEKANVDVRVVVRRGRMVIDAPVEVAIKSCPEDRVCHVEPSAVTVTLNGPKPSLAKVKAKTAPIEVYVDATDYDAAVAVHDTVRPNCDRPAGVECTLQPRAITLHIVNPDREGEKKGGQKAK
jgi:hypothetical protein